MIILIVCFVIAFINSIVGLACIIDQDFNGFFAFSGLLILFLMTGLAIVSEELLCAKVEAEVGRPVSVCDKPMGRKE